METPRRLLAIMGSGETSPTMVKTHRELLGRLGPGPVPAVVLDTPFGFQENRSDLAARAVEYFRESVGHSMEVASFRSAGADPLEYETMLARLRQASYVFAGPGSPSYALRNWRDTQVPGILADKLRSGGCLSFSSAAALTLGVATIPVYEIYKAGEEPRWLEGLDLLGTLGVSAAVIPHFNNSEGGTHDTRFCYLGERRLAGMEEQLPAGAFVLGVDEHTALILDVGAGTAMVTGRGVVTVRCRGESTEIPAGSALPLSELVSMAQGAAGPVRTRDPTAPRDQAGARVEPAAASSPLLEAVAELERAFAGALVAGDVDAAVRATLELEAVLVSWSRDTLQSDELDKGRAALRGMVVGLGALARGAASDPSEAVRPLVEGLLGVRESARAAGRWAEADSVRSILVSSGVEVQDAPGGTTWRLLSWPDPPGTGPHRLEA